MSTVDNGEEEVDYSDTPSKPGSTRPSFINLAGIEALLL